MGNRYYLTIHCPWCNHTNEDIYFAPTSEMTSFNCPNCGNRVCIGDDFEGHKDAQSIDMRVHSNWGNEFEAITGAPNIQRLPRDEEPKP